MNMMPLRHSRPFSGSKSMNISTCPRSVNPAQKLVAKPLLYELRGSAPASRRPVSCSTMIACTRAIYVDRLTR